MGVQTAISVDEYLQTAFPDLDREYRDGEIVERSLPDYLHGKCQLRLGVFFMSQGKALCLHPCSETRMRLSDDVVLILDIAVFHPDEPSRVPDSPPLIAIEILSLDDRLTAAREKLGHYKAWGVPHVWLVDPQSRRLYTCDAGLTEVASLAVPELGLEITPDLIFD